MTALTKKPQRSCRECVHDGGWHYEDDGDPERQPRAVPCPNKSALDGQTAALKLTADAHEKAQATAKGIIRDAADSLPEFSANQLRDLMEAADIDKPVIGAAFNAAREAGWIEPSGRMVQSTEATTRHKITVWRSLRHRPGGTA